MRSAGEESEDSDQVRSEEIKYGRESVSILKNEIS
jgi:hypothetical protein